MLTAFCLNSAVNGSFPNFRDTLKKHYNLGLYFLQINVEDLSSFDEHLADMLYKQPTEHLPIVSCHV